MVIPVKLLQPEKGVLPLRYLLSMVTLVRLVQEEKAPSPMLVTLSGMVTPVRLLQPENAYAGITSVHPNSMLLPLPIGPALVRLLQFQKERSPMLITLSGMVTLVRPLQPENA